MIGLIILSAFLLYLIVSASLVWVVVRFSKKKKWNVYLCGGITAALLYHLVFWDLVPTYLIFRFHCVNSAGAKTFINVEQWVAQNPGVYVGPIEKPDGMVLDERGAGRLRLSNGTELRYFDGDEKSDRRLSFENRDGTSGYWLNNIFYFKYEREELSEFLPVWQGIDRVVDSQNGHVIAERVIVHAGRNDFYRIWTSFGRCGHTDTSFSDVLREYEDLRIDISY